MRPPPAYDRSSYQAEIWKARLRRFARVAGFALDLAHSLWVVLFGALVGAIAGVLLGGLSGHPWAFWAGLGGGVLAGGAAGAALAKRVFFGTEPEPEPLEPTPGADRWPGIEDQFKRVKTRVYVFAALLLAAFLLLAYLGMADRFGWPIPYSLPPAVLAWSLVGFLLVLVLLMVLTTRCPRCRGILWRAAELYECPHCGVVLRD